MKRIVFIAGHLGYPLDKTPLGGGAAVGLELARRWSRRDDFGLTVLGSGPHPPESGIDYHALKASSDPLISLSEFGYARFCREFGRRATEFLSDAADRFPPSRTCIVLNDIAESPDVARLAELGYALLSIWHVDVVDYFNKMYFRGWVAPERLTRAYARMESVRLGWAVPGLLRLVFGKQRDVVAHAGRLVVPSRLMAETIERCYGEARGKIRVIPWGGWDEPAPENRVADEFRRLKSLYRIGTGTRVLMTMSRVAPEKGLLELLEALRILESRPALRPCELCVLLCGEPAFMRGTAYYRRVRFAARHLHATRVFFPGHLDPVAKQAHLRMADLFVSPSLHESYGLSIVEALRAGVPVLASDHSGAAEILSPEFSRVVAYNGDGSRGMGRRRRCAVRLAQGLENLLDDRSSLKAMGRAAARAGARMSFDAAALKVAEESLALLDRHP